MPYNAANRKDIRAAEKVSKHLSSMEREVVAGIMSVANGRQWVYSQLSRSGIFRTAFAPDALMMAYNEGLRSEGVLLFNDIITYCPNYFITMLEEENARNAAAERPREQNTGRDDIGSDPDAYPDGDPEPGTGASVN
jgi:hypothetical protein